MLGIFTGIEVLFFWLGFFSLAVCQSLIWLRYRYEAGWPSLALLLTGVGTMMFAIAWAISSVLEKEPQSASMSMIVIFLPGLVLAASGARLAWQKIRDCN